MTAAWGLSKFASQTKIKDLQKGLKNFKENLNDFLRNGQGDDALKSALNCSSSFIAGTEVLTPDGLVNIEDIKVGDWVISDDPNTPGEVIAKQVTRTFERTDNNGIYDVSIGDKVISSTGNHDFWTLGEKLVSVENLELGNWIIFDDPLTENILEAKQVLKATAKADGSYELQLDDEIVTVSDKQEFWIKDEKWVQAKDLESGDLLQTDDGDFVAVDGIEVREGSYEVYNFEVEDFHTYFVSQDGVLVHNIDCDISKRPTGRHDEIAHGGYYDRKRARTEAYFDNTPFDFKAKAQELGYTKRIAPQKAPFDTHGQDLFYNAKDKTYISRDIDGHNITNGWKMFNKKGKRIGTYTSDLDRIKD